MNTRKLTSTEGFLIVDLPDAASAVGPARLGEKLIAGNAVGYAREITYGFAIIGEKRSGATLGLKTAPDQRDAAVDAAAGELADELTDGRLMFDPGLRMPPATLKALVEHDKRPSVRSSLGDAIEAQGIVAAISALCGSLDGVRVAIDNVGPVTSTAATLLEDGGASIVRVANGKNAVTGSIPARALADVLAGADDALASHGEQAAPWSIWKSDGIDVAITGAKVGALTDQGAQLLGDTPVVCHGVSPIATKAIATSHKAGGRIVPAFVSAVGRRVVDSAASDADEDALRSKATDALASILGEIVGSADGPYVAACKKSEEFMRSWADELPFGRPMA